MYPISRDMNDKCSDSKCIVQAALMKLAKPEYPEVCGVVTCCMQMAIDTVPMVRPSYSMWILSPGIFIQGLGCAQSMQGRGISCRSTHKLKAVLIGINLFVEQRRPVRGQLCS